MKNALLLKRVCYGKKITPIEDREYVLVGRNSPVGTIKEWKQFAKDNKFDEIKIVKNIENDKLLIVNLSKNKICKIKETK